jgi:hypothetical protein
MIAAAVRQLIRQRAGDRCEYCRTHQDDEPLFRYQVEHVIARQHGGTDDADNLALACPHCNRHKGPNLTGIDPLTGAVETLFHPRRQSWPEHFEINGGLVLGRTPTGRATVRVLAMNDPIRVELRQMAQGNP